jgi:putative transposase
MAQSLANLLIHIIFSTKHRQPHIVPEFEHRLHQYITSVCHSLDSPVIYIGGMPDHIHILLSLSRTITVSELISKIKSNSSRWIKTIDPQCKDFSWQKGFGAFSLGESSRNNAIKYIANQKKHHATMSFQEEYLKLLMKYDVKFDEKYLWD